MDSTNKVVLDMAREKKDGKKVSYIISTELLRELDEFCERTGRTKTKVIEIAIRKYLDSHKGEE